MCTHMCTHPASASIGSECTVLDSNSKPYKDLHRPKSALWMSLDPTLFPNARNKESAKTRMNAGSAISSQRMCTRMCTRAGESSACDRQARYVDTRRSRSRCRRNASFMSLITSRAKRQSPPLNPLRAVMALPSTVRGPVDRSHGFQVRINAACRARRSGVQPFAIAPLQ